LHTLRITQPDDWHLHLRDGDALDTTVPHTARHFGRAIVMPNLKPPIANVEMALDYRQRILEVVPEGMPFSPLMTLYLTDKLSVSEIAKAQENEFIHAIKYYPAGATTNSENGVTDINAVMPVLEEMARLGLPLLIHGEVTDADIDIFDREEKFIDTILSPLLDRIPELKIVLEHITTSQAVQFVSEQNTNIAATITPHHLLYNRNDLLAGGVRPHFYCLPILKRDIHQKALGDAAISGNSRFFLGTDSAPHARHTKETDCGCAGIYSAAGAIELYTEFFDQQNALDKLEGFASHFGADFYGLPRNTAELVLEKKAWSMPQEFRFGDYTVVPMRAGEEVEWSVTEVTP
jgi:dihydroorotase